MKTCLICHHESPRDTATCPRCGEASWSAVTVEQKAPPAEPVAPAAQPQQQSRKGNRR